MAYKSSRSRDVGKELQSYQNSSLGQGFGGGGGAGSPVPFSATGGTKTEPGDGFVYHVFGHPNPGDNFVVSSTNPADLGGSNIEVYIQGNGGSGGGKGGGSGRSSGGGGGASALWTISITDAGTYPVTVCGGRGPRPGGTNPYGYPYIGDSTTRFTHCTIPGRYVQANGGNNGGWNGTPNGSDGGSGNAVGVSEPWSSAGAVLNYFAKSTDTPNSPTNPAAQGSQPFQTGKQAGHYGLGGTLGNAWWDPYAPAGGTVNSPSGPAGQNYGGGGSGIENPASASGAGAQGRMVIRYPDSL